MSEVEEVKRLHEEGKSIRGISKELNLSKWKVERALKDEPEKKKSEKPKKPTIKWNLTRGGFRQIVCFILDKVVPPESENEMQTKMFLLMLYTFYTNQLDVCKRWGYSLNTWVNPAKELIQFIESDLADKGIDIDWDEVIEALEKMGLIQKWE